MRQHLKKIFSTAGKTLLTLLVLAVTALPAVFMNSLCGYLPILFVVILLLLSAGCLFLLRRRVSVVTGLQDLECVRGKAVDVGLQLRNDSRLACPRASASLFISDLFGGMDARREIPFSLAGRDTVDLGFGMDMSHVGLYSVGLEQIRLWDFCGLVSCRIPVEGRFTAFVMPRIRPMDEFELSEDAMAETDMDTRVTVVGGMDYTGVRDYTPGDPMKQIHWKLSAHTRSYMTRLQESSRQQEFAVLLDFAADACSDRERLMDFNDCLIETALSLIAEISTHEAGYALLYTDKSGHIARTVPRGRENDMELLRAFAGITPAPPGDFPDAAQILRQESRQQNRAASVLVITTRPTPELLEMLLQVKRQRRSPVLYYIYPASWNSRELEDAVAPLRQLHDADVPYFLLSTAVNREGGVS